MHRIRSVLALIALTSITPSIACSAQAVVPDWMELNQGETAYFGVGFPGEAAPACPTFDRYIMWLTSVKARTSEPCPTAHAGQRVTVLGWKMHSLGPGLVAPIVHVRFARSPGSAWTLAVNPVVPPGAAVVVSGIDCSAEAARVHVRISSSGAWLSACRAVVVKQVVSSSQDLLVVRFLRSGTTVRIGAGKAVLPRPLYPNGFPRYPVSDFANGH